FFFFSSRRRHTRFSRDWSSTCALPISNDVYRITVKKGTVTRIVLGEGERILERGAATGYPSDCEKDDTNWCIFADTGSNLVWVRSEERRVGKECRSRGSR